MAAAADRQERGEGIAVVGVGCRFPGGASGPEGFWSVLRDGVDVIGEVPRERQELLGARLPGPGGYLDAIDAFDPAFFGIAPREAREMDPQQRLLLEVTWEALEDAGQTAQRLSGSRTGVFVGVLSMDYLLVHAREVGADAIDQYYAAGKEFSFGAGRISYALDLRGPSLSVSTACSSSLVAVHLACRSLRAGESDLCVAGGVNVMLSPELTRYLGKVGALSPSGRCKVFDASADGIVRGEGCGVVVLKRLADALRAGDRVLAVIRGSAVNHDGGSAGLTVPNGAAQQALLQAALADAQVSPDDVTYVEAHGTGTPLGDPIELRSLAAVLCRDRPRERPLYVGSLKTNFGHTDAAAGVAGLVKVVLALHRGEIPPHLHMDEPNPMVPWDRLPLEVPREATPWEAGPGPRIAGVSAFGLSGTNAHVVVEEAPQRATAPAMPAEPHGAVLLTISARSEAALRDLAAAYATLVRERSSDSLADIAFTAATRRSHHCERLAVTGDDREALAGALERFTAGGGAHELSAGTVDDGGGEQPVFVFSGQGSQWAGMGRDLLAGEPAFAAAVERCDTALPRHDGWSLEEVLGDGGAERLVARTDVAQPAIVALQIGLAEMWASWGVEPAAVVGHSVGEIAAAHVAGVLTLDEAMTVAWHRGQVMHAAAGRGGMMATRISREEAAALVEGCAGLVWLAGVNGPRSVVLSGDTAALTKVREQLEARGVRTRPLGVDYAFHSGQMLPLTGELSRRLAGLEPREPRVPIAPTVTCPQDTSAYGPGYWACGIAAPVEFRSAFDRLLDEGHRTFLELGPHPSLAHPMSECLDHRDLRGIVLESLRRGAAGRAPLLRSLRRLYVQGLDARWQAVFPRGGRLVTLPTYAWQRQRLWLAGAGTSGGQHPAGEAGPPDPAEGGTRIPRAAVPTDQLGLRLGVRHAVAGVLGLDGPDRVAERTGFFDMGMDSVTALELRDALEGALGCTLPATVAFDYPTVQRLGDHLAGHVRQRPAPAPARAVAPATRASRRLAGNEVAVIGAGCRFPGGADSPETFWRLLRDGVDAVTAVPPDREELVAAGIGHGAFLEGIDTFDATFFRISPREARAMDPQQRLFLEVAWEALERSGQVPARLAGSRTGVFVGMNTNDYLQLLTRDAGRVDAYYGTGNSFAAAAGRLSYFLGLHGPSLAVDTACSSSLVAVHLAVASLRSGESDLAIAGGVNVILAPTVYLSAQDGGALAPDGRCKAFDAAADGYGRGEGCGAVVLKLLSKALEDGDEVLAVIAGSATNSDGASSGLAVPNGPAQEALVTAALADAGLEPAAVGYVEAHGTGTALGDPIEAGALGAVLCGPGRDGPLRLGSVKTNIGHLEAASGIAGLIKAVLCLRHRQLPPSLHCSTLNPEIARVAGTVEVQTDLADWEPGVPLAAGVSAFGFTGTNAHVVLLEPPARTVTLAGGGGHAERQGEPPCFLLPVSAHTEAALREQAGRYAAWLGGGEPSCVDLPDLADVCYTASLRRGHQRHRLAVAGPGRAELVERLTAFARGEPEPDVVHGDAEAGAAPRVAFVFSGYGSQYTGMGRRLLRDEPVFRSEVERCDAALRPHVGWSVRSLLDGGAGSASLSRGDVPQELIFVVQLALAAVWRSYGVEPEAVVGHSVGEVAAAYVAGALDFADAVLVLTERSRLLSERLAGHGSMAVVGLPEDEVTSLLAGREEALCVAVCNSPSSTVLSGDSAVLAELLADLQRRNVFCRLVEADGAGHSALVEPLRAELVGLVAGVAPRPAHTRMYSTVTGSPVAGQELDAQYWGRNLRETVRFRQAIEALLADGLDVFLEVSPHPLTLTPIEQTMRHQGREALLLPSMVRDADDSEVLARSLGALHVRSYDVRFEGRYPHGGRQVDLPATAWQRRSYWLPEPSGLPARGAQGGHPLLVQSVRPAGGDVRYWEVTLSADHLATLGGQDVAGSVLAGEGVYLEMAAAAGRELFGSAALEGVTLHEPLACAPGSTVTLQLAVVTRGPGAAFDLHSVEPAGEATRAVLRASGSLVRSGRAAATPGPGGDRTAQDDGEQAVHVVLTPAQQREAAAYLLHPALLSGALAALASAPRSAETGQGPMAAVAVRALRLYAGAGPVREATVTPRLREAPGGRTVAGDVRLADADGTLRAELLGVELCSLAGRLLAPDTHARLASRLYTLGWRPEAPAPRTAARPAATATGAGEAPAGARVIFADRDGLGGALAERASAIGVPCTLVEAGTRYERVDAGRFVVDPCDAEGFRRVLAALPAQAAEFVYLWGTDLGGTVAPVPTDALRRASAGALHLLQALEPVPAARAWIVTRGAQALGTPAAPVALAQAPLWGLGTTGALELGAWVGLVDLDPADTREDAAGELASLLEEAGDEDRVAVRGGRRFVARLGRLPRPSPLASPPPVRDDGTYLVVTGGDDPGPLVAAWLAEQGAGRVVLAAPSWAEDRGLDVTGLPGAVDLVRADPGALAELLGAGGLRALRGVVCATADLPMRRLAQLTADDLGTALERRVGIAWTLHEQTAGCDLDFFVLGSSAASVWGSIGMGRSALADAFLDGLALHRRRHGQVALSVNWVQWADGLEPATAAAMTGSGLRPYPAGEALEALAFLLAGDEPQAAVADVDWGLLKPLYEAARARPVLADVGEGAAGAVATEASALVRSLEGAGRERGLELLTEHVSATVATILGVEDVRDLDAAEGFFELGMNSVMALELKVRLERSTGLGLPATLAFECPTSQALAARLATDLLGTVAGAGVEVPPAAPTEETTAGLERLEELSDDELLERLDAELKASAQLLGDDSP